MDNLGLVFRFPGKRDIFAAPWRAERLCVQTSRPLNVHSNYFSGSYATGRL